MDTRQVPMLGLAALVLAGCGQGMRTKPGPFPGETGSRRSTAASGRMANRPGRCATRHRAAPFRSQQSIHTLMSRNLQRSHCGARLGSRTAIRGLVVWCLATVGCLVSQEVSAQTWNIPRATVRSVLQHWSSSFGYSVMWSDGLPDFPTKTAEVQGSFVDVPRSLVNGSAYGASNMYCPRGASFPPKAFTLGVRVDDAARMVFVVGVPTELECRPLAPR
jgi:hypothetical protein